VFDSSLPAALRTQYASVAALIANTAVEVMGHAGFFGLTVAQTPQGNSTVLESAGGVKFVQFAKTAKWDQDLYESLVQPYYEAGAYRFVTQY
jgi:hypothetical protein